MIVVLVNPRSRANRRNPRIASEFQALVAGVGRVVTPRSLEDLDREMAALRAKPPTLIAVHGGDGTLHRAVTALGRGFGGDPIPPLAILGGGTMNVVAASLGIRQRPMAFLTALAADARAGRPPETLRRRCIRVGEQLGFIFGNGLMANFLGEYYGTGKYGPARAAWLLLRAFASAIVRGPFVRRLFKRFEGTVRVDGLPLERTTFVGLAAGTVSEVGLGFKLIHRANDDVERFGVLAIHAPPLSLLPDFWSVHAGRGMSPRRAFSSVATTLEIIPKNGGGMAYTIDGDLYRSTGSVSVSIGPPIAFVKPAGALIVANRGDTMRDQA
jgi:diacylglycerol kinase (ATP)